MRYTTLLTLAAAAVSAQQQAQNYTSALDMEIDFNSVDPAQKATWCRAQQDSCDTLCADDVSTNDCDYTTIEYDCKCASNGSAPGLQYYKQTMPWFICDTLTQRCISANEGNQRGQDDCRDNIEDLCGTLDPNKADVGGDNGDDEDDEESEETSTTASPGPSATESQDNEEASSTATNQDEGDFAAATAAPILAALGIVAALV